MIGVAVVSGAVGAVCRYLLSGAAQRMTGVDFPIGTVAVNLVGSFLLGLVVGAGMDSVLAIAAAGFLGGFTTFSTWILETLPLRPFSTAALANLAVTLVGGVAVAALGYSLVD